MLRLLYLMTHFAWGLQAAEPPPPLLNVGTYRLAAKRCQTGGANLEIQSDRLIVLDSARLNHETKVGDCVVTKEATYSINKIGGQAILHISNQRGKNSRACMGPPSLRAINEDFNWKVEPKPDGFAIIQSEKNECPDVNSSTDTLVIEYKLET